MSSSFQAIDNIALLARVREIVVREGISVSSREIAKEIGISGSVLFQRFGSAVAYSLAMFERIGIHDGVPFSHSVVRDLARLIRRGIAPADHREQSVLFARA